LNSISPAERVVIIRLTPVPEDISGTLLRGGFHLLTRRWRVVYPHVWGSI
jgi:hypothetical protein